MIRQLLPLLFFMLAVGMAVSQEKRSKADVLYFEYAYADAIAEYRREQRNDPLRPEQQLNLAHAYLKVDNYNMATEAYLEVFKMDSVMTVHHFNDMFRAMARTSGIERVKAFLATKKNVFTKELLENAEFNFELMTREESPSASPTLINLRDNSPQADFAPAFFEDRMLFTSARLSDSKQLYNPSGESFLDIYVARLTPGGDIQNTNPFTNIPESDFHEATPYFAESLKKVFFSLSNAENGRLTFDENGKNSLAIGIADMQGNFNYLLRDLSTSFSYPFYEGKSGKLYFSAKFEDSYGGMDLYYVYTNEGLIMSAPVNLGPRINTPGNEIAPYVAGDNFYFSSDIFYGLGGMDLYKSVIQQDESFSIPVNLGHGLNSEEDDFGLIIKPAEEGYTGYFASNRPGGKGNDDLYGFSIREAPGLETIVFRGTIVDPATNFGLEKVAVDLKASDSTRIKQVYTDNNGRYRIEIPARDSVLLTASKPGHAFYSESFGPGNLESIKGVSYDIEMPMFDELVRETGQQKVVKIDKFFFDRNSAEITPQIEAELDKVVAAIQMFPKMKIGIEVHTDSRGSSANNLKLSQNRANSIRDYLLRKGISPTNISDVRGFGEERITNNCKDGVFCLEMLHNQNERQLIVIQNYEDLKV
jgi:outer membrane protein OmpA-like peptidoglycan-associated protein